MVTVGFVVEGESETLLVKSEVFRQWLRENCNLEVVDSVVDASGNGNVNRNALGSAEGTSRQKRQRAGERTTRFYQKIHSRSQV